MLMGEYDDELVDIYRKSCTIFNKKGMGPFLGGEFSNRYIPDGWHEFDMWDGLLNNIACDDEQEEE